MTYEKTAKDKARGLIDSEYEALEGMTKHDLYCYLIEGFDFDLTREETDELFEEYFG